MVFPCDLSLLVCSPPSGIEICNHTFAARELKLKLGVKPSVLLSPQQVRELESLLNAFLCPGLPLERVDQFKFTACRSRLVADTQEFLSRRLGQSPSLVRLTSLVGRNRSVQKFIAAG